MLSSKRACEIKAKMNDFSCGDGWLPYEPSDGQVLIQTTQSPL